MKKREHIVYLATLLSVSPCIAQEKLGIANSNYSGTNSIFLNPAMSVDSKTYMQLNLAGMNAFAMTNLAYLPGFWLYGHDKNAPYIQDVRLNLHKTPRFAYVNAVLEGPAFVISKRNYGAGFFIRARSVTSLRAGSLLSAGSVFIQEETGAQDVYVDLKNTRAASMSWIEYGGNFGMVVKRTRNTLVSLGANLRYLSGINLLYIQFSELNGYYNSQLINVEQMKGRVSIAGPALNSGRGAGLGIGLTYKRMLGDVSGYYSNSVRCNCRKIDYKYRIGFSLRDFGFIRFKQGAYATGISSAGIYYANSNDTSYKAAIQKLTHTELSTGSVLAGLPAILSGQLDWNFENNLYMNVTLAKNIMPGVLTGVQGPDLISFTPRYEWRTFEAAMPLTFMNYVHPLLGFALRYRSFVIGLDNILPFIIAKNTYGAGIYVGAGVSLFRNPACRKKTRRVDRCPVKTVVKP